MDGLLTSDSEVILEEIKTVQGRWDGLADPLHWAQAKIYGFIYAQEHGISELTLRLTYLELDTGKVTEFTAHLGFADCASSSTRRRRFTWSGSSSINPGERNATLRSAPSSSHFSEYRPGQRQLAVAVYRAISRGGRLFLEAPTGIGKTISVLFPSLKALAEGKVERIFYLTARTTARTAAEKAVADLRPAGSSCGA